MSQYLRLVLLITTCIGLFALELDARAPGDGAAISIVPKPVKIARMPGSFAVTGETVVFVKNGDAPLDSVAAFFASQLRAVTGFPLAVVSSGKQSNAIVLSVEPGKKGLKKEGYELKVTPQQIDIVGFDNAGVFYGVQTLYQLLPEEVVCAKEVHGLEWTVPCVQITDYPRFPWRGMHLDVGRHFMPVSFVKKYLDLMAMYKLNTFHWHLTEDQGWRIEIKRYPLLTQVGAWRKETMGDGIPAGGFYTQDQIRDVVEYAKDRQITIVPEIEMPGHARAALSAYPQYSCRGVPIDVGTKWGVEEDVYCAGNDSTYVFIENILTEVFDLFPGRYIHIGGDECPKARWKECPKCQAKIKAEGLHNEEELQSYFVKRIEAFVNSKGKRIVGWDEILEGGLAPNATVMSWRGTQGGIDAAKSGHDVVMTPTSNCYLDYSQALTGENDVTRALLTLESVYNYEPVPPEFTSEEAAHVLGSQGNVWTEWMPDSRRVEYMVFPRMCALSEMVWTPKDLRNYDDFTERMGAQYNRLTFADVNYRVPTPFVLGGSVVSFTDTVVSFSGVPSDAQTFFTTDGEEPNRESFRYVRPFKLGTSSTIKARTYLSNGRASNVVTFDFNKLDSTVNGMIYTYRFPKDSSVTIPNQWTVAQSGITYFVALPSYPATPGSFSVTFSGFLKIEKEGLYTFYIRADSASIVSVNHVEVVNGGPADLGWWRSGKMYLKAGTYPMTVLDLELDRWRGVVLEYDGPGIKRQSSPPRLLTRE